MRKASKNRLLIYIQSFRRRLLYLNIYIALLSGLLETRCGVVLDNNGEL